VTTTIPQYDALNDPRRGPVWAAAQWGQLPVTRNIETPSGWAEKNRYLPPALTPLPGFYQFSVAPYLREIADCLSIDSSIREVTVMKGAQVGVTVGILENAIGYYIAHVKRAPMMFVTADADLAKLRIEQCVVPMLHHSGLMHLIQSQDRDNARKTGKTDSKIEWEGGGYLVPFGAQNANKLRSLSIQILLNDEIDGWPDRVGKDGDPLKLVVARTSAYEESRKIANVSTPLIKGQSKIADRFAQGDQRRYFVACLKCGLMQVLRWKHVDNSTGAVSGIVWQLEDGRLVPGSVRYVCQNSDCGHEHHNDDKTRLLAPGNAEWRPTAVPGNPQHRSYHLSALYSPVGMQSWESLVHLWLEAWDVESDRPLDIEKLQVFYNNVLGEPFELRGEKLRFDVVSPHRRQEYRYGEIPNAALCVEHCGGPVLVLTCAVDVHKEFLAVAVFGWCRDRRAVLVDYRRMEGDTEQLDDPGTWGALRELIENREFVADDGKRYKIQLTLIDSGYRSDQVYQFAKEYLAGVYPVKGRETAPKAATLREFSPFTTPMGQAAYGITVDIYKERWHAALRRQWDGISIQPSGHFNAPVDTTDKQLKELTVEVKRERIDERTKRRIGFEWYRPSGASNELWDLLVYNNAALEMIAWDVCRNQFGLDTVNLADFYAYCETEQPYYLLPGEAA
jgi:phage terminase large subunit GpA-like protein